MRAGASSAVRSTAMVATRSGSPISFSNSASLSSSRPAPTTAMPICAVGRAAEARYRCSRPSRSLLVLPCHPSRFRQCCPDLMLQYLAGVVLGQAFPDDHLFRHFELRDAVVGEESREALDIRSGAAFGTMTAQARSPVLASGSPTINISTMSGCPARMSSISFGAMFSPLRMMMSFALPVTTRKSSSTHCARSPVRK